LSQNLTRIDYLKDLDVDGKIILEWTKLDLREIGIDGANWIRLAQDLVPWRAFVNMVMNLQVA
jgi:hypothetical protein